MRLLMLGVNHRTAPVALREKLALDEDRLRAFLDQLRARSPGVESVVLSTCNRTEVYLARPAHAPPSLAELRAMLSNHCGVSETELESSTIHREQLEAVAHVFRVCAGLESMVLGEPQILGQVRRAYEEANARACVGPVLHRVFQQALRVGKSLRARTGLDAGRLSVGSVAVDFARNVFDRFDDKCVVGLGAGQIMKLALRHFAALRPGRLEVSNRTAARAQALVAELGCGLVRPWEDRDELLVEADVMLVCTGASQPVILADHVRQRGLMRRRRNRPLFIIDLGVPRDVDPALASFSNVYLYNIDDLQAVTDGNQTQRQQIAQACEPELLEQARACLNAIQHQDLGVLIRQLRERLSAIGDLEQQRTIHKLRSAPHDNYAAILAEHTHRVINKILHLPLSQFDRQDSNAPLGFYAAALRRLFALDDPGPAADSESKPDRSDASSGS